MNYLLKYDDIKAYNESEAYTFPKYTTQLINLANQNAQGTRPAAVGRMSELFPEFMSSGEEMTIENWRSWYTAKYPDVLKTAVDRVYAQVQNLKGAVSQINRKMVENWVNDLVINKTFNGMYIQKAILSSLAERKDTNYRLASPEEESAGIDGYVGDVPYSIKPDTYKTMRNLPEKINVGMVYYTKTKAGFKIEAED